MAISNSYKLSLKDYRALKKAELGETRKKAKAAQEELKKKREESKKELENQLNTIKENTEQPKGLAKFTPLIISKGSKIALTMTPALLALVKDLFPEGAGLDVCPNFSTAAGQEKAKQIVKSLNGIIDDLNQTSEFLDNITRIAGITTATLGTIQTVSTALKYSIPVVSTSAKVIPIIPGIVVSALDDLDWINNNLLYKNDGTPKLPKLIAGVGGITASTAVVSFAINKVVVIIETLKEKVEKCIVPIPGLVEESVSSLSPSTLEYAKLGNSNFEEQDPVTYNGFVIRVETVPFTPTVNRYQAVGFTASGIPLIKGDLSFTPNAQVLVNELKFIIDRDNLKAY